MKNNRPTHIQFKNLALQDPDTASLYHDLEEEYHLLAEMIQARHTSGKTQAEVADLMGIKTSAVGRLETSLFYKHHSPTLKTLKKYAHALGYKLELNFIPNSITEFQNPKEH